MPHLEVKSITKRFGRRRLFRKLTFELGAGQSIAITGANGSGKSTLLKILAGVLTPTAGTVLLTDQKKEIEPAQRPFYTALVAPYLNVYDGLTARENLQFIARARGDREALEQVAGLLKQVGLGKREDDLVGTYSSGMKQRVKFAAALLVHPIMLLLDEPGSNLDQAGIDMMQTVIEQQKTSGRLLILATNDPVEAGWCDKTICVEDYP